MPDQGPRYAVYFVPAPDTALYRFGSAVLGYDCYTGHAIAAPEEFTSALADWQAAVSEPRVYGFHATLKAPFHLRSSSREDQLVSAIASFAALRRTSVMVDIHLQALSGFCALVPRRPDPAVDALAADCTTIFDAFRAPMSASERARRVAAGLTHGQIQNLDRWGYPYLFGDFRFHMTLTGRIAPDQRARVLSVLQMLLQRMEVPASLSIDRLSLVKQASPGEPFRVVSQSLL